MTLFKLLILLLIIGWLVISGILIYRYNKLHRKIPVKPSNNPTAFEELMQEATNKTKSNAIIWRTAELCESPYHYKDDIQRECLAWTIDERYSLVVWINCVFIVDKTNRQICERYNPVFDAENYYGEMLTKAVYDQQKDISINSALQKLKTI